MELIGRLGNQLFQAARLYAIARKRAIPRFRWIGEVIFDGVPKHVKWAPPTTYPLDVGYAQDWPADRDLRWTRAEAKEWFPIRPDIMVATEHRVGLKCAAHLRRGDYVNSLYPLIGKPAFVAYARTLGIPEGDITWISDDSPGESDLPKEIGFMSDFRAMMGAEVLLRGNSTFSWWAACLGSARVHAPDIVDLKGGVEYDKVKFTPGNWQKLANLPFVHDLWIE